VDCGMQGFDPAIQDFRGSSHLFHRRDR
jgi:hypothetical protein